ncbi:MAG: hypothetical protein SGJ27_24320 [Candidatus Melainabacteria bacterium]|nr:hypothetical protein [Candidatus Melainabacteria bacterium]
MPKQQETFNATASDSYLKSDAQTGRHFIDLNSAMNTYSGAWLYGQQHVQTMVGRLNANWEQFLPVPADLQDGILLRGNVLYRHANGGWNKSQDLFEGVLHTNSGNGGVRMFVGKTQHTFYAANLPNGHLKVVANLNIPLTHRSPSSPLVSIPQSASSSAPSYSQNTYSSPSLSYPGYSQDPYASQY